MILWGCIRFMCYYGRKITVRRVILPSRIASLAVIVVPFERQVIECLIIKFDVATVWVRRDGRSGWEILQLCCG
jgi:hypothetical protein